MAWKLIVSLGLLSIVHAIEIQHSPLYKGYLAPTLIKAPIALKTVEIEEGPAEYEFSYSVHDPHTGDIKAQKESRKGDVVEGSYELIDPDGHRRIVQYTADKHSGFNAIVHREPTDIKIPIPEQKYKIIAPAPKIYEAPVLHYAHAPVATKFISAPITKVLAPSHGHTHVSFSGPAVSYHY